MRAPTAFVFVASLALAILFGSPSAKAEICEYSYWGCVDCEWTGPLQWIVTDPNTGAGQYDQPRGYDQICEPFPGLPWSTPLDQITPGSQGNYCRSLWSFPFEEYLCFPDPVGPPPQPAQQAVINLTAIWRKAQPWANCEDFGSGWSAFAWDGTSELLYCKQVSDTLPATAVVNVAGIWGGRRGTPAPCSSLGADWSAFTYDGKANMLFCMKTGPTSGGYVHDMTAIWNGFCSTIAGGAWTSVVWNGKSQIDFCADFN